jgi:hypothetical protein
MARPGFYQRGYAREQKKHFRYHPYHYGTYCVKLRKFLSIGIKTQSQLIDNQLFTATMLIPALSAAQIAA